ncbi:DUF7426 family protein [Knoellia koreensis]|uniref:DUF7426 domain-containing protein n=1 Tax=Knoellia koreensis TaxID=2730921 RepID=A0A849HIT5_9MICO|nr:hypothetical protein [Knoellia sp. DB2414S]NNM44597.1 hypothetical protein [Knoellia sp. DB2414S]
MLRDSSEILDLCLRLPIHGKTYEVYPPSPATHDQLAMRLALGIALDAGVEIPEEDARTLQITDDDMPDFATMCLGDTYEQMLADEVSHPEIELALVTAFYAWTLGMEVAEAYWESGGRLVTRS